MKMSVLDANLRGLYYQRNIFAAVSILLGIVLVVISCFLFVKRERIVVVPPVVGQEFWVDGNTISPTYLEQFGVFLGELLLNKSAQSALEQRTIILRHTDPSFSG